MAKMTQEELDKRLAEVGGNKLAHSKTAAKKKVPNPRYDKYDRNSQEEIEVDVQQWKSPSGHVIQAYQNEDGSWEVVQDESPAPSATASQGTVVERDGKTYIIKDGKATPVEGIPAEAPRGTLVERDDGTYLVFPDGSTKKVEGLPPKTPATPSPTSELVPVRTPDGRVVGLRDEKTGDVIPVTQKDPQKPNVFETKDGRIITISPDGTSATDITPEGPEDKPPPEGLEYVPDYDQDDGGLSAYNERLMEAWRAGRINRQTGMRLLQQAAGIWEATASHGGKRRDQANTERATGVTQRGQTLDEVASRRTSADNQANDVNATISKYGATLIPEPNSGYTVVDAYRAMLNSRRDHVEAAGGYQEVPEIPPTGGAPAPIPGSESTQVVMHPGGRIEVSPPGAAPPTPPNAIGAGAIGPNPAPGAPAPAAPAAAAPPAISDPRDAAGYTGPPAAGATPAPVNPAAGEPGNDPTKPVGLFDPDSQLESLVAMGFDPTEARNAISLYRRGVRADRL